MAWLSEAGFGDKYWVPCYRGTVNGWPKYTFHSRCDGKGPTLTLARKESNLFGGFNDQSWQSENPLCLCCLSLQSAYLISDRNN